MFCGIDSARGVDWVCRQFDTTGHQGDHKRLTAPFKASTLEDVMVYRITLVATIVLAFVASLRVQRCLDTPLRAESTPFWQCRRIVSLAPSITETLYALGLGDRVVGVTDFCRYPSEVQNKARIGGFYDPNFEAILVLKPDLVIMLEEHSELLPALRKLKIETLVVCHKTIPDIIESFRVIGRVCGRGAEGRQMARVFENRLADIQEKTRWLPRPRVLFVTDRTLGCGRVADVYVAADDRYFDEIIKLAGGRNACEQRGARYPVVSAEGLLWLNPDVIVDLIPENHCAGLDRSSIVADWNELAKIEAVKNGRVLVFGQDYACVPGPRFLQLVEELARALHPNVDWGD